MITTRKNHTTDTTEKLRISGMDCADCAISIEKSLEMVPGVRSVSVSFGAGTAQVSYDPAVATHDALVKRVSELGYNVEDTVAANTRTGPLEFVIEGMDCADCARTIEKTVEALPGVAQASVNFGTARLSVTPTVPAQLPVTSTIERVVTAAGYRATPVAKRRSGESLPFWKRERRAINTAVGTVAALVGLALSFTPAPAWLVNAFFAAGIVVAGAAFARAGLLALRAGRADMNLLMTVAAVGAVLLGDWGEAVTVVLLFAFGGTLQSYTLDKTRGAIRALMDLTPATALVRRADRSNGLPLMREVRLPVEEVQPGETVLVGHGERLPLDGVVLQGTSSIDQSPITGESVPVDVEPGAEVFAGTINGPGALSIRVERAAKDTTLARIIEMVEEAQGRRAPSQQFVDRFSAIYTPVVIAAAALIAILPSLLFAQPFSEWFYRALVLLVVACPCALVISTPVSIVSAIGAATRRGVLLKGGATLEALGKVKAVAFDKTGTLTEGRPRVVAVRAPDGNNDALLKLAGMVEARSEHPLAKSIVHAGRNLKHGAPEASDFKAFPGLGARAVVEGREVYVGNARLFQEQGIPVDGVASLLEEEQAQGRTAVLVGTREGALGVVSLADNPRHDAKEAIRGLREAGITYVAMLTGDNPRTAEAIAREVGVDECYAGLLPADKLDVVERITREHGPVAMVGDGVNDAPALAAAEVGIAMGVAGTDAALEVADVALMSDDLSRLDYAVLLSRRTLSTIQVNIAASLLVKAVALVLAAFGWLPLWGAIFADMGVSLLVTLNGMRLLAYGRR
ncbi:MAG TPA: heavy metal translocating P-type ATPase [Chloroflexia bacterium]